MAIQFRRGTDQALQTANETLAAGQPCYDSTKNALKIGNGSTAYNSLSYLNLAGNIISGIGHTNITTTQLYQKIKNRHVNVLGYNNTINGGNTTAYLDCDIILGSRNVVTASELVTNNIGNNFIAGSNNNVTNNYFSYILGNGNTVTTTGAGTMSGIYVIGEGNAITDNNLISATNPENIGIFLFGKNLSFDLDSNLSKCLTLVGRYNVKNITEDGFVVGSGTNLALKNQFRTSDTGTYGSGAYSSSGADYAEMFEWIDGNINNEDRRGYFVTLEGEKIRKARASDDYILGVISANPTVLGDCYFYDQWQGKYLKDVFGNYLIDENNQLILNPEFDETLVYVSRNDRSEWSPVGMLGKLIVRDDGTCQVDEYCSCNALGEATATQTGYRVIARIDENHIKIIFK